ncbi:YdcF family protein [Streptomyces specialis]|uniref:YdcF family protein n=1 Tax=Streptomyces specialis TaxID=498367 RepID=UPI00073E6923|nr:YdcF family protein [Streptomyces specialis]
MSEEELSPGQVDEITRFVDIEASPPEGEPTAHFLFGTNRLQPVEIAAERYHRGLAPLIIATGGVNRHNGIVEGSEFRRLLIERGVPDSVIRHEDRSTNTWQNVEFALPFLREALESGWRITAISKWFHRRTVHSLATLLPDLGPFYAIAWEPVYAGKRTTRTDWPAIPDGRRRVIREWREVSRRVEDGSFRDVRRVDGAWPSPL